MASDLHKYSVQESLNLMMNTGEDALKVDIDNVTLTTEGSDVNIEVHIDQAEDSILAYGYDGSSNQKIKTDASGNIQIDVLTLPSSTSTIEVVGDAAENAAVAGNPVLVGGRYDSSSRTLGDGDVGAVALDADGAVHITDGGNALTVDGTVTANLSATDNAVLDAMVVDLAAMEVLLTAANVDHAANEVLLGTIDADTGAIKTAVEILDNAISGSEMQVDVVASLPAGSAAIGKLAANSGVDIGDVDVTSIVAGTGATNLGKAEDAAHSSGDTGVMALAVRNDDVANLAGADGDYSPLQVNAAGSLYSVDETGQAGSILVTGTTAVTSAISNTVFVALQFLEDTVFNSGNSGLISSSNQLYPSTQYTGTDIDGDGGAVADSVTFPQGMTLFGRWSGFQLASGKLVAYIGYV